MSMRSIILLACAIFYDQYFESVYDKTFRGEEFHRFI